MITVGGIAAFLALTVLAAVLLGVDCYRDYLTVLSTLGKFRTYWINLSLAGFWHKLFNSQGSHVIPLWQNPALAWTGTLLSDALVTGATAWFIWRSRSLRERDLSFALTIIALVLVSPLAWDHYFTLLFLPLVLLWLSAPPGPPRVAFWLLLIALWLPTLFFWRLAIRGITQRGWMTMTATPRQAVTVLSMQTYILLALFVFTILVIRRLQREGEEAPGNGPKPPLFLER
jgi:hypothetical protein